MTTAAGNDSPIDPDAEIELKLSGQPEALETIFASPAICDNSTGRGVTRRLENVYYDTHDQRLRARGLAFRVRRHGRRYVQTLKSNDTEGLVSYRGEWETPLASSEPDLAVLPVGALEILQGLVSPEELETQFTTRVKRRVRRIRARCWRFRCVTRAVITACCGSHSITRAIFRKKKFASSARSPASQPWPRPVPVSMPLPKWDASASKLYWHQPPSRYWYSMSSRACYCSIRRRCKRPAW